MLAVPLICVGWSLAEISKNARRAFSRLPGCEAAPPDPYSDAFMELLPWPAPRPAMSELDTENEATGLLEPDEVIQMWRRAVLSAPHACADLLLVSVYNGEIAAAACKNVSAITLSAYFEFKFVLAAALSDVVPRARRAADSIFLLDLGSRADAPVPQRHGSFGAGADETSFVLPKLAASGGCASRLPVPIALPGFGSQTWQAIMREPVVGGGAYWRWPDVKWDDKRPEMHFEGRATRDYGPCEDVTLPPTRAKCASPAGACTPPADATNTGACRSESSCETVRHPHMILKELPMRGRMNGDRTYLQLRANFSAGNDPLPTWNSREAFAHLANSKALLELDAIGHQSLLLAKLTLGSVVVTQSSSFPLWFEPLLTSGSVLRVRADLSDLPRRLQWLAAHDGEARGIAEAGRRQACALMHLPHVAGYLGRLLQRYARIFDKPNAAKQHRAVRHLVVPYRGGERARQQRRKVNPFDAAERLWFVKHEGVSGRLDCSAWWIGEYACHELRQLHRKKYHKM